MMKILERFGVGLGSSKIHKTNAARGRQAAERRMESLTASGITQIDAPSIYALPPFLPESSYDEFD